MQQPIELGTQQLESVAVREITHKIKSIEHFIHLFGNKRQLTRQVPSPTEKTISMKFVCQVLSGEKFLVLQGDVSNLLVPLRMQNFSIEHFWRDIKRPLRQTYWATSRRALHLTLEEAKNAKASWFPRYERQYFKIWEALHSEASCNFSEF